MSFFEVYKRQRGKRAVVYALEPEVFDKIYDRAYSVGHNDTLICFTTALHDNKIDGELYDKIIQDVQQLLIKLTEDGRVI